MIKNIYKQKDGGESMKYKLEIQHNGFDVDVEEIIKMVKKSLKNHRIPVTQIEDLRIYYAVNTRIAYYTGFYNKQKVSSEIYLI